MRLRHIEVFHAIMQVGTISGAAACGIVSFCLQVGQGPERPANSSRTWSFNPQWGQANGIIATSTDKDATLESPPSRGSQV